jgi:hypothetical protein
MLGLGAQADRVFARAHEIPEGVIVGRRNVDRRELAGAMPPGQGIAVTPIGLDPIAAPLGHARGIDDDAVLALGGEIPVDPQPAGARFVHEPQPPARRSERPDHFGHGLQVPRDHPVVPDLAGSPLFGDRDVDRFLVDIHPHEHATFRHGLPPLVCGSGRRLHRRRVTHDNNMRQVSWSDCCASHSHTV